MADIRIPNAALEAGVKAFAEAEANDYTSHAEDLATACLAMLGAWPGMNTEFRRDSYMGWDGALLILPLPQEARDER